MIAGFRYKTIRWKMLESIEKPRIVHMRCTDMINKGNIYGQVTVRFHTRQVRKQKGFNKNIVLSFLSEQMDNFKKNSSAGFHIIFPTDCIVLIKRQLRTYISLKGIV